ncbi:MAG: hypothetical protein ACREHG_02380 [Candidatus Saccharimonadales bacterium]
MNLAFINLALRKNLIAFLLWGPFVAAIVGCVPIHSVEYEIKSPVGHGANWNCNGTGGPTTALAFEQSGVRFIIGVVDEIPPQLGVSIWMEKGKSMYMDWGKIKVLSDDGEILTEASTVIYRRDLRNQKEEKLSDYGVKLHADPSANVIYNPIVKPINGGLPDSFFIIIPERRIGNLLFPSVKAHFKKTTGWTISPVNC